MTLNFFSVPIIPEFLYTIRHQNDKTTTTITTTTTTILTTNNFTYDADYDPAAPIEELLDENDQDSSKDYEEKISQREKYSFLSKLLQCL